MPEDEYDIPRPKKIKLKETKPETAHRIYRREQKRLAKEARRIARANAMASGSGSGSGDGGARASAPTNGPAHDFTFGTNNGAFGFGPAPPRPAPPPRAPHDAPHAPPHRRDDRAESLSPPRYGPRAGVDPRTADDADPADDFRERMAYLEAEELGRDPFAFGAFAGWGMGQRIPARHWGARNPLFDMMSGGGGRGFEPIDPFLPAGGKRKRDAAAEVAYDGGPVPPLGEMSGEEYAAWVRDGMYRRRHRDEIAAQERLRAAARERERERERAREYAARENAARIKRLQKLLAKEAEARTNEVAAARKAERAAWRRHVAAIVGAQGDDVVAMRIGFADVPWPVYAARGADVAVVLSLDDLTLDAVRDFLFALADDEGGGKDTRKARTKVLRDAIRIFHPDRFYGRVLPRVRDEEQEAVKEGVERCSRLINELLAEK